MTRDASAVGDLRVDSITNRNSTHIAIQGNVVMAGSLLADGELNSLYPATLALLTSDIVVSNTLSGPAV